MTKQALIDAITQANEQAKRIFDDAKTQLDAETDQSAKAMQQFKIIRVNQVMKLLQEAKDNVATIPDFTPSGN